MFVKRLISAIVIIAVFLCFILFSHMPWVLSIGVALLSACAVFEALKSTKYFEGRSLMVCGIILSVVMPFLARISIGHMLAAAYVFCLVIFFVNIIFFKTFNFKHVCVVATISTIISFFFSIIVPLREMEHGLYYLFLVFISAWMTDCGAYIVGSLFGRHKLCPLISPKKTVEGAIGGVIFAVIGVFICTLCFRLIDVADYKYYVVLPMTIGASVISQMGDLIASIIKRTFNIKDFGNVIPGHGGVFDRFDSLVFVAPYIFIIFNVISPV